MNMAARNKYEPDGQTAADRAMVRFVEMMAEKISTLQKDWTKPWFTETAMKWPKNLSGREYNGMNALFLMMQCEKKGYELPVFGTFNRLASLNYTKAADGSYKPALDKNGERLPAVSILKNEKSFPVFITSFTVVDKETKEKISMEDYRNLSDEEKERYSVYPKLNVYNVFNIAQSNLQEARPELYARLKEENGLVRPPGLDSEKFSFAPIDEMVEKGLWLCPIRPVHQDAAYYSISKDEIVIPLKSQFVDGESYIGTLLHEMVHSTGAESRLNRLKPAAFSSAEYAREELVAELGSALIASKYGITKYIKDDSAAYLKSWLDSLKESPEFLKTTLYDVKRASALITGQIDAIQEKIDAKVDLMDADNDGNTQEVAHEEKEIVPAVSEEYVPYRRGR